MIENKDEEKSYGKSFDRIMEILDILEEKDGPDTTNAFVREMKKTHKKIRHETIKKYLELIYEISRRGTLEKLKESKNLVLWNFKSYKKDDANKLFKKVLKYNSINGIEIEDLRKEVNWPIERLNNAIRFLIKENMIQFESNKIYLERSLLNFEEWLNNNSINPRESRSYNFKNKRNLIKEDLNSPKLKKNRA